MYIKFLRDVRKTDFLKAGGKGANLGELMSLGLLVPNGFVLLRDAYDCFVKVNNLDSKIQKVFNKVELSSFVELKDAKLKINELFSLSVFPDDLRMCIEQAYEQLNQLVIIRSSATNEDSISSSFAGILETRFNLDQNLLIENIKKCWASIYNPQYITYVIQRGLYKNFDVGLALVIQEILAPNTSGVCFTYNPITKNSDQVVIETVYGLGELIVSGRVIPDTYVFDIKTNSVIESIIVRQQFQRVFEQATIKDIIVDDCLQKQPKLDFTQIVEIVEKSLILQRHYGYPQDIEFAFIGTSLYFLQTRPITNLHLTGC